MLVVRELHIPRSMGANLQPQALDTLQKPFEFAIKEALFSFPYKPDNYYYVITAREQQGTDDYLLIIDPELLPSENDLFISIADGAPLVRKYSFRLHRNCRILGTIMHASKAGSISTAPLD